MKRRSAKQRCEDLAREFGWSQPEDEGRRGTRDGCITIECPPGTISDDVHGIVEGYWHDGGTRAQAYAYISERILAGVEQCDMPDCCEKFDNGNWLLAANPR